MITRPGSYFCDAQAVAELASGTAKPRGQGVHQKSDSGRAKKQNVSFSRTVVGLVETRNPRSVWPIASEPLRQKHFAAFPTALVWRCLQASTSAVGCCPACGAQYAPQVTTERIPTRPGSGSKVSGNSDVEGNRDPQRHVQRTIVHGHQPTCGCKAGAPVPAVVLDPFAGSGRTLQVAVHSGRQSIGCEMLPAYLDIQAEIIPQVPKCLRPASPPRRPKRRRPHARQRLLIE